MAESSLDDPCADAFMLKVLCMNEEILEAALDIASIAFFLITTPYVWDEDSEDASNLNERLRGESTLP
jgi:hypothetical protein